MAQRVVQARVEREFVLVRAYLSRLRDDPLFRGLATAPVDDEGLSPEDEAALKEAYEDLEAGRMLSDEELNRRLSES